MAPILPFLSEAIYLNLITSAIPTLPESVHLTRWPAEGMAPLRDERLERSMAVARRAVDLARTLRAQAGLKNRQPLARLWLALPGGELHELDALVPLIADEVNVKAVELIGDESALVDRRVKVLLPKVGARLGPQIPAVMAAAREGAVEIRPDGSVELAGVVLAADEVEILATPRPGMAVAHDDGLVVVIDTGLTPALRAEGDARELQRAIQDLRKEARLDLDDEIDLRVDGLAPEVAAHLGSVAAETLAVLAPGLEGEGIVRGAVNLEAGEARMAIRRRDGGGRGAPRA